MPQDSPARPLVSVITIFLDEARFLREAVESVFGQDYTNWELLLVDDGSTDESTSVAKTYAASHPGKVSYLEHPGHANLGMSAARNLGLRAANGSLLAFVDADDVWLPHKLDTQVRRLSQSSDVDMMYGSTLYWHSWTHQTEDLERDFVWRPVEQDTLFTPPDLLVDFLDRRVPMPCMGSILVRRALVNKMGGWVETFEGLHEDQVFFAKACIHGTILATPDLVDHYRQHPDSCCAVVGQSAELYSSKLQFLSWLDSYLLRSNLSQPKYREAVSRERERTLRERAAQGH